MFGLTFIKKRLKIMDWMAPEKSNFSYPCTLLPQQR